MERLPNQDELTPNDPVEDVVRIIKEGKPHQQIGIIGAGDKLKVGILSAVSRMMAASGEILKPPIFAKNEEELRQKLEDVVDTDPSRMDEAAKQIMIVHASNEMNSEIFFEEKELPPWHRKHPLQHRRTQKKKGWEKK